MFNNPLFNSTGSGYGMPQYVQQPSAEGQPVSLPGANVSLVNGKLVFGAPKAFNPMMATPDWAKAMPSAPAAQFSNPMFNSAPNPYIAPQAVMQPAGAAAPAKGVK
jgi:hypothetical protein